MTKDRYEHYESYTPVDNKQAPAHDAIYIASAGDIVVKKTSSASAVTFTVPDGALLRIKAYSIQATGTDAAAVILLRDSEE